jgi:hypothetical protein
MRKGESAHSGKKSFLDRPAREVLRNGRKAASLAILTGLVLLQMLPQDILEVNRPENEQVFEDLGDITDLEQNYPTIDTLLRAAKVYDGEQSNEHVVVYGHEGLDGLSFVRPTMEVSKSILDAETLTELQDASEPYFNSIGLKLFITELDEYSDRYHPVTEQFLGRARDIVLAITDEVSMTPREILDFANIDHVVITSGSNDQEDNPPWVARARVTNNATSAILFNAVYERDRVSWHHELGHHLHRRLNKASQDRFTRDFLRLNPDSFIYADDYDELEHGLSPIEFDEQRKQAARDKVTLGYYSSGSISEDIPETYRTLWVGLGTPHPDDGVFGTTLGQKRVLIVEYLDQAVPGFRQYAVGRFALGQYYYEPVPQTEEAYHRMLSQSPNGLDGTPKASILHGYEATNDTGCQIHWIELCTLCQSAETKLANSRSRCTDLRSPEPG